jgi:hypothetical protein
MIGDARHLAMALGLSPADADTYRPPCNWQDSAGNIYSAASWESSAAWFAAALQPLTRPAWDTDALIDMAAAARAQAAVVLLTEPAPATPAALTALIWPDGPEALALMGLAPVPTDDAP